MADDIVQVARCQVCGNSAEVRHLTFRQNTGMVVLRQTRTQSGMMCRSCAGKVFGKMTLHNLFLGWWGVISMLATPVFIVMNIIEYSKSRALSDAHTGGVGPGRVPPTDLPQ